MLLTLAALYCAAPSLPLPHPDWWARMAPTNGLRLGLDLQGGMHLILKVNIPSAVQNHLELTLADLRTALRKQQIVTTVPESAGAGRMRLRLTDPNAVATVKQVVKDDFRNLDLVATGNGDLDLGLKPQDVKQIEDNAVAQSVEILRNRIDQFGVAEPVIVRQGRDEIVLQLPGVQEPERAIELVGRTAQLEFKLVDATATRDLSDRIEQAIQSGRLLRPFTHKELNHALKAFIPAGDEIYLQKRVDRQADTVRTIPIVLKQATLMTGEALKTAHVAFNRQFGEPYVTLTLNARGARLFDRLTQEHVGRQLAIVLDDIVQSAPVIRERIVGGTAQISGSFTAQEANDLAIVLRAGALPAPVEIVQNLTVGPSLGRDSIQNGVAAAILGAILVVTFMIVYYRLSGTIANLALLLNLLLLLAALSLFRATLTLPGLAGIVLSIGMAVDSNVLIFERMREELALNQSPRASVTAGYDKALWTIIDAHVTTLITAFALFLFGTGPIKGFAVTLSLGVLLNLFTALYGTRVAYDYLYVKRWLQRLHFLQILRRPHIDFIRLRHAAFLLSSALVALGLLAFVQIERGKANLGVDFAGGAMVQFKADKPFQLEEIRAALNRRQLPEYDLQEVPQDHLLLVRVKASSQSVENIAKQADAALAQTFPHHHFVIESQAEIGASVSRDLKRAALIAIAVSLAGIIGYLAWRFDRRFSIAATMATFHDVLAVLGIFYVLDKEITLLVVTALLTLAGYSLTDTVVVFDRIRERLRQAGQQSLKDVINQSINEVLSRTLITSSTVLMVLISLLLLGGPLLRDFALALFIGVVVGTYSSIFVASPIVYVWPTAKRVGQVGEARREVKGSV
jgi:SecD/SecF fusion protein